jgi:hypothetical protein
VEWLTKWSDIVILRIPSIVQDRNRWNMNDSMTWALKSQLQAFKWFGISSSEWSSSKGVILKFNQPGSYIFRHKSW